jgi:hypothetical protein
MENENTRDKTKPPEETHTPCTPFIVTVCPIQTPSPTTLPKEMTDYSNPHMVATTVPCNCSQPTTNSEVKCSDSQAMGAVIGILMVLLVVMTTGYIYICWNNMKKRGGLRIISKQIAR